MQLQYGIQLGKLSIVYKLCDTLYTFERSTARTIGCYSNINSYKSIITVQLDKKRLGFLTDDFQAATSHLPALDSLLLIESLFFFPSSAPKLHFF